MHELRSEFIGRFVRTVKQILHQKQQWLDAGECYTSFEKESILFLYPVVINTYNSACSPSEVHFLEDVSMSEIVARPEQN